MIMQTLPGYMLYLVQHKWHVLMACCRLAQTERVPALVWRGIAHDCSKLRLSELLPYAAYFSLPPERRDEAVQRGFWDAVRLHKSRNRHHPEQWLCRTSDGHDEPQEMTDLFILEMVADWRGAGIAQGCGDNTLEWYATNRDQLPLAPVTRAKVEKLIGFIAS